MDKSGAVGLECCISHNGQAAWASKNREIAANQFVHYFAAFSELPLRHLRFFKFKQICDLICNRRCVIPSFSSFLFTSDLLRPFLFYWILQ